MTNKPLAVQWNRHTRTGTMTDNQDMPDRVRIATKLTASRVNNYWRVLNISKDTWLKQLTPPQRYEMVLSDLLDKLAKSEADLDKLKDVE